MIKVGRIVSTLNKAPNGINNVKRVRISIPNEEYERVAYAKSMGDSVFLIELMCALLGRELGIPIPEPIIAFSEDGQDVLFVSSDVKHPDLTKRLNIQNRQLLNTESNKEIIKTLAGWPFIVDAISFDEWIANHDRNLGNILFDGKEMFVLIDHDGAMRLPFSPSQPIAENALMNISIKVKNGDELGMQRLKREAQAFINELDAALPREIAERIISYAPAIDNKFLTSMVKFLNERLNYLETITLEKVPVKQMSL
jgi:hypothetical protein